MSDMPAPSAAAFTAEPPPTRPPRRRPAAERVRHEATEEVADGSTSSGLPEEVAEDIISEVEPPSATDASSPDSSAVPSPRPRRTTPEWVIASRPIKPGLRRVFWWFYKNLQLFRWSWVPVPRTVSLYWRRVYENRAWVYENRLLIKAIVQIFTEKGGSGKSTISTWLAAEERMTTEHDVLLVDADSGGGHVAERFELDPDATFTTSAAVELFVHRAGTLTVHTLQRLATLHGPTGVFVTNMLMKAEITREAMAATLRALWAFVATVYVDCTPGFKEENTYGTAQVATVALLPGCIHVNADMSSIKKTLDDTDLGFRNRVYDGRNGFVIVIEAVRWKDYNLRTVYHFAEEFRVAPEDIVLIPYDPWLHATNPVRYDRSYRHAQVLRPKTRYALSELLRRRAEVAMAFNKSSDQHTPPAPDDPSVAFNE